MLFDINPQWLTQTDYITKLACWVSMATSDIAQLRRNTSQIEFEVVPLFLLLLFLLHFVSTRSRLASGRFEYLFPNRINSLKVLKVREENEMSRNIKWVIMVSSWLVDCGGGGGGSVCRTSGVNETQSDICVRREQMFHWGDANRSSVGPER